MKKILLTLFTFISVWLPAQRGYVSANNLYNGLPVFHGPKVVGNYPGTDFIFTVPATGERPMEFYAENLPIGLSIDKNTGIITGNVKMAGEYKVRIVAMNHAGNSKEDLKIMIGDKLCLTPPMGWNSWNVFTSTVNEKLIMEMADAMVANGMRDLGYQYVNMDDDWHAKQREADGRPKADSVKFPHGMKYLSDYVHSKGLKLGIYSCAGSKTCGGEFGGYQHEEIDAKTYADWGIDLLKYDYCNVENPQKEAIPRYSAMGKALKNSGRSIVFSICEWGGRDPWNWGTSVGGSYWRTTGDIMDVWENNPGYNGVMRILARQKGLEKYAGPGHWNDPDMLIVGNHGKGLATGGGGKFKGLTQDEYYSHFAMWCMLDAPLLTSCDLRNVSKEDFAIITDPLLLTINQDEIGEQAHLVRKKGGLWFYSKKMSYGMYAIAVLNTSKKVKTYALNAKDLFDGITPDEKKKIEASKISSRKDNTIPVHGTAIYIVTR